MTAVPTSFADDVRAVIVGLRPGQVVSYGDVAAEAGRPLGARGVGQVLARSMGELPWWRVVYADGRLAPCDPDEQRRRLRREGVEVRGERVHPWGSTRA